MNPLIFFIDPVLRAPTIGALLMCIVSALVGVVVFVRKQTLVGEMLSHAAYPGVVLAIILAGVFNWGGVLPLAILTGAALSAALGLYCMNRLVRSIRVPNDAALCGVLTLFFGVGIVFASYAQHQYPLLYRQIQAYLYGQTATMTDSHLFLYAGLTLAVVSFLFFFYKELLMLCFDPNFSKSKGVEALYLTLVVVAVVIGIRCSGVVLLSAMFIAPPTAARQFTHHLPWIFILSAIFGGVSGFLGTYLSVVLPVGLPTGPTIVLIAGALALLSLLFAPKRGVVARYVRAHWFRAVQREENLLKTLWHMSLKGKNPLQTKQVPLLARKGFQRKGWLIKEKEGFALTTAGSKRGAQIVRLHRLWEVYLVNSLGLGVERVHKSAEEMEHILTPELEERLTRLLGDPKHDPHEQPIPARNEAISHG